LLAAAIMEGSSIAIGRRYSLPLITKFVAIPSGRANIPIAFSIIVLALSKLNADEGSCNIAISCADNSVIFFR
jgi:hypothetical protein